MKKNLFVISILIVTAARPATVASLPFPPQATIKQVTSQEIDNFNQKEFKKNLDRAVAQVKPLREELKKFSKELNAYSNKSLKYQQNYQNLIPVINSLEGIHQKPFIISVSKLLQYKLSAPKKLVQTADTLIQNLMTLIHNIQTELANSIKENWHDTDYTNLTLIYTDKTMADIFKKEISNKFPFKIKKIIRAHSNWQRL